MLPPLTERRNFMMKRFKRFVSVLKHTGAIHIFWSYVVVLCIAAVVLTLCEPNISRVTDGLWYCFIASTTVGFGDLVAVTLIGRILTVVVVLYGIVTAAMVPGVALTYYLEFVKAKEKETTSLFLEKLENLPNLSREELQQISKKVKELKK